MEKEVRALAHNTSAPSQHKRWQHNQSPKPGACAAVSASALQGPLPAEPLLPLDSELGGEALKPQVWVQALEGGGSELDW